MLKWQSKAGFTLIEILVAVAIIAVLTSIVLSVAVRIDSKGRENQCEGLMATLNCALRQFCEYGYNYRANVIDEGLEFYRALKFPLDCNEFSIGELSNAIEEALDVAVTSQNTTGTKHEDDYSASEALYFFLSRVPDCRKTLQEVDTSFLTSLNSDDAVMEIKIDGRSYALMRILDSWGTPLKYDYYDETEINGSKQGYLDAIQTLRTFPLITSAGPDEEFGTPDDITNRIKTKGTKKLP
jgi:prepilin-type N-terminal cleavage/methylation domain-containing protein